jgi:hypothetical protein
MPKLRIDQSAIYTIRIQGALDSSYSDFLNGLAVTHEFSDENGTVTILSGQLLDQAALIGVLDHLYNMRFPLLSVEYRPVS